MKRGTQGGEGGGVMARVVNQVKRLKEIVQRVDKLVVVPLSCLLLISYISRCVYNVAVAARAGWCRRATWCLRYWCHK